MNIQKTVMLQGLLNKKSRKKPGIKGDIFAGIFENMKKSLSKFENKTDTKNTTIHPDKDRERTIIPENKPSVLHHELFFLPSVKELPHSPLETAEGKKTSKEPPVGNKETIKHQQPVINLHRKTTTVPNNNIKSLFYKEKTFSPQIPAHTAISDKEPVFPDTGWEIPGKKVEETSTYRQAKGLEKSSGDVEIIPAFQDKITSHPGDKVIKRNITSQKTVQYSGVHLTPEIKEKRQNQPEIPFSSKKTSGEIGHTEPVLDFPGKIKLKNTLNFPLQRSNEKKKTVKRETGVIPHTTLKQDIEKTEGKAPAEKPQIQVEQGVELPGNSRIDKPVKEAVPAQFFGKAVYSKRVEKRDFPEKVPAQQDFSLAVSDKAFNTPPATDKNKETENIQTRKEPVIPNAKSDQSKKGKKSPETQGHKIEVKQSREIQVNSQGQDAVEHVPFNISTTEKLHQNRAEPKSEINTGLKIENTGTHVAHMHQGSSGGSEQNNTGTHYEYGPDKWDGNMENHNENEFQKNLTLNLKLDGISLKARYNGIRLNLSIMMKDITELNFSQLSGDITQIIQESGIDSYLFRIRDKEREYRVYSQTKKTVQTASSREINVKV